MEIRAEKKTSKPTITPVRKHSGDLHKEHVGNVRSILRDSRIQSKLRVNQENDQVVQQMMPNNYGITETTSNSPFIQRQEHDDATNTEDLSFDPSAARFSNGSTRVNRCYTNPEFPDFRCLVFALKNDIDENLRANAHHFYRIASLFPDDNEQMWNTFMRYGLGVNLLQTSFEFLGANETFSSILSYGTGVGLKSYNFFQNGALELDVPTPLGQGFNLDLQFGLNADPNDLSNKGK